MEANSTSRGSLTATRLASHRLSSSSLSSSIAGSISSRKSRQADPVGTSDVAVESTLSMPPPALPMRSPRTVFPHSRRASSHSEVSSLNEDLRSVGAPSIDEDFLDDVHDTTPRLSARSPSRSSANMSSKGLEPTPGQSLEAGLSNVSVTTSVSPQSATGHQLTPREHHSANPLDLVKRRVTPRSDPGSTRSQPARSRSRAKRRFSGSTGASSHSPSSDRGPHMREREETRPAPFGVIGVCALDTKARSKASRNILDRLATPHREFDVKIFGDKAILDEDVENWPICDYLISFYSDGFPLDKAIAYVNLRKPFCVNDVPMQQVLWDRRLCLRILDEVGVPTPTRIEINRDGGPKLLTPEVSRYVKEVTGVALDPVETKSFVRPRKVELLDDGDILSVDGTLLKKPFVEKPTSGEDHNLIVYYPRSEGGGARKLFRKIGNKSSEYFVDLNIPRVITEPGSSYIYEKYMHVDNAEDVKAYTVGPEFCHAETRKSPVVDGVVQRNTHGKEVRYVTELNPEEKEIAKKISNTFGQRVCGFDILRSGDKSYVIDVNGWSFVKDNDAYYNHCATILKEVFVKERIRRGGLTPSMPSPAISDNTDPMARAGAGYRDKDGHTTAMLPPPPTSAGTSATRHSDTISRPSQDGSLREDNHSAILPPPLASPRSSMLPSKLQNSVLNLLETQGEDAKSASLPALPPSALGSAHGASSSTSADHSADLQANQAFAQPPPPKHSWKLKGLVSVIRHADRTPKQKYKFTFHTLPFIDLLRGNQEEVLLMGEPALASVLDAVDIALTQGEEDMAKLRSLRNVLVKKGSWPGTKVQIKPMFNKKQPRASNNKSATTPMIPEGTQDDITPAPVAADTEPLIREMSAVPQEEIPADPSLSPAATQRDALHRSDSMTGVTMSKFTAADSSMVCDKLQLIVKWGGESTHAARYQATELAQNMRSDYMLLNREVLDEVHVFSSSERRVTASAAIWTKNFLQDPDLADDYIKERKDLLDDSNAAKDDMDKVKKKLKGLLRKGNDRPPQFAWPENTPEPSEVQTTLVQLMKFHRRVMDYNFSQLGSSAVESLQAISNSPGSAQLKGVRSTTSMNSVISQANAVNNIQNRWCCGEDADLFRERWDKLFNEFCDHEKVDPSKISELYDTMKFDALHNRAFLEWVFTPPKHMLEEEYGIEPARDGKAVSKDAAESKTPEEILGPSEAQEKTEKFEAPKAVRRLFRRRSWMKPHNDGSATPEQYFHLHKGTIPTKAKTDARFEPLRELYHWAKVLFDFICPQEYGISNTEKLEIGLLTSLPLLKEIVQDLEEMQASEDAKSFFYFTKESHIYTLLNCILEGGIETKIKRSTIPELDYLSQICFELWESEGQPDGNAADGTSNTFTYSIRMSISPGCHVNDPLDIQLDSKHCIGCAPRRSLTPHLDWKEVIETLRDKFHQVKLPKSFLAVNLSDAFSFQEKERHNSEGDVLDRKDSGLTQPPMHDEGAVEVVPGASELAQPGSDGLVGDMEKAS